MTVSLPSLPDGVYTVSWKALSSTDGHVTTGTFPFATTIPKNGTYAGTCGTFNVGSGTTTVEMTVSYRLADYDAWVISRHEENAPWLLSARIASG